MMGEPGQFGPKVTNMMAPAVQSLISLKTSMFLNRNIKDIFEFLKLSLVGC